MYENKDYIIRMAETAPNLREFQNELKNLNENINMMKNLDNNVSIVYQSMESTFKSFIESVDRSIGAIDPNCVEKLKNEFEFHRSEVLWYPRSMIADAFQKISQTTSNLKIVNFENKARDFIDQLNNINSKERAFRIVTALKFYVLDTAIPLLIFLFALYSIFIHWDATRSS